MAFKFDVQNPGLKEFGIAAGGAVGVYLLWKWWSNRQAAQAGQAGTSGQCTDSGGNPVPCAQAQPYGGTTPTGLGLGALLLWLQDHASSTTTTTTTTKAPPPAAPKPKSAGGSKPMPDVTGQRANFAIGELKSGYGVIATTTPPRNPRAEYVVTGQTPAAGSSVSKGSRAVLRVTQVKAPAVKAA